MIAAPAMIAAAIAAALGLLRSGNACGTLGGVNNVLRVNSNLLTTPGRHIMMSTHDNVVIALYKKKKKLPTIHFCVSGHPRGCNVT